MDGRKSSKYKDKDRDDRSKKKYKNRSRSRSNPRYSRSRSKDRRKSSSKSYDKSKNRQTTKKINKTSNIREVTNDYNETKSIDLRTKTSNFSLIPSGEIVDKNSTSVSSTQCLQTIALAQAAKVDRKLYIGNLPTGITPSTLVKLLNAALAALKANTQPGDPVLSAWISTDGHYAFVEFRSAEEANNGFQLNNILILGQPLKVGRPKTYTGALSMMEDGICNTVAAALQAGTMNAPIDGNRIQFPSRILCFKGLVRDVNIEDEEEYKNVSEDVRDECSRYGRVVSVFMPKKDLEDYVSYGVGNFYIEFQTLEEAKEARKQLSGRKYNGRTVNIIYFSEEKYIKKDFDHSEITIPSRSEK